MNPEKKQNPERFLVSKQNLIYTIIFFFIIGSLIGFFIQKKISYSGQSQDTVDMKLFWEAWNELDQKYPFTEDAPTTEEKVFGAIKGLARSYEDPHIAFLPPKESTEFDEDVFQGEFGGIGIEVGSKNGFLLVIAPLKESPAEKAGILSGDIIYKINGEYSSELDIDEAIDKIRGQEGTDVTITVLRKEEVDPIDFIIKRGLIQIPTVNVTEETPEITRIALYNFNINSVKDFIEATDDFINSGKKELILDLRNNPGGFLESGIDIASLFLEKDKIVMIEDLGPNEKRENFYSKGVHIQNYIGDDFKMVVLINEGSASASEILAGALKYHKVGTLIGEKTFGKGSVQEFIPLKNGNSAIKITVAKWLTPDGTSIDKEGIEPDYTVKISRDDYIEGRDTQLEQAINYLKTGKIKEE